MRHGLVKLTLVAGALALSSFALHGPASALPAGPATGILTAPAVLDGSQAGQADVEKVRDRRRVRRGRPFQFYFGFGPQVRYYRQAPRRYSYYSYFPAPYYYYAPARRYNYRYW